MAKINVNLGFTADTSQAQRQIDELAKSLAKISQNPATLLDDTDLRDAVGAAKELEKHLQKAYNVETGKLDLSQFSRSLASAGKDLNYFQTNLSKLGADGDQAFLNLAKSIAKAETPTIRLNSHIQNLLDDLIKVTRWQLSSSIMHGFMGAVQTAHGYAQDLNESLTNIRIVTGQNTEEMAKFAEKANDAAKALSTTTVDYSDAALIYYQQGLEESDIEERTAITIKMANAVGQSVETVSEQLTAIWNNYYDGSKSLEYYADVLMRLGADTASSSDEISEGLGKFSAVADSVGLSYEYAASALATITATTRESANTVGTALKTLFSRIQGLKFGETLEDGTDLNKYSEALATVGVNIKTTNGELKEMDDILDEVGVRWKTLASDQKMALAQTVAGVRQYNQFVALMDNWDYFQQNLNSSLNSTGSLTEQAEIYAESWEASEKRVRAAAEGVYQSLINDEFFIDFNEGLALGLEGVEGLVKGMGGMKGILSSVGSIFLSIYAKEIPSAITKLTDNFKVLTGQATSSMQKIQTQNIEALKTFQFADNSQSQEIERKGLIEISRLKQQLTEKSHTLSKAEIQEAESMIQSTEAVYNNVAAMQKQLEAKEKIINANNQTDTVNIIRDIEQVTQAYNSYKIKLEELKKQKELLSQNSGGNNTELQEINEQIKALETNEGIQKLIHNMEQLEEISELTNDEISTFAKGYDPFKNINAQGKETRELYEKISQGIKKVKNDLEEKVRTGAKLSVFNDRINDQIESWKNNKLSIEQSKQVIESYLKSLEQVFATNMDMGLTMPTDEIKQLSDLLDDPKAKVEDLRESFIKLLNTISDNASHQIIDVSNDWGVLQDKLVALKGGTNEAKASVAQLIKEWEQAGAEGFKIKGTLDQLDQELREINDHTMKVSEIFGKLTSGLMQFNAQLNAISSFKDVWNDEDASQLEKIGALIGVVVTGLETLGGIYTFITPLVKKYSKAKEGAAAAETAGAVATNAGTAAIEASAAALKTHPVIGIIAVALTIATAALGNWIDNLEKEAKAAKEAAKANKQAVEERQKTIQSNSEIIQSMDSLLKIYEETGEGKEELDKIANQLAETYDIEGAALARLSGEYSHYQTLLDQARKKRILELEANKEEAQKSLQSQGKVVNNTAREKSGYVSGSKYNLNLGNSQYASNLLGIQSYIAENVTGASANSSVISIDYDTESIVQLYDELDATKKYFESQLDEETLKYDADFKKIESWLTKMKEAVEAYKEEKENIELLEIKLGTGLEDVDVKNYQDYQSWISKITTELHNMGKEGDEVNRILDAITGISTNANVSKYQEIEKVLNSIKATGTKVSEDVLVKLWEDLDNGTSKWDEQTLLTLNWGQLTNQTWREAADAVQNYNNAIANTDSIKKLRDQAASILELLDDDISKKDQKEIYEGFDWGNEEKGIIKYSEFLQMTLAQQKKYLSQFSSTAVAEALEQQIQINREKIEDYQKWLASQDSKEQVQKIIEESTKALNLKEDLLDGIANYTLTSSEIDWSLIGGQLSEYELKNTPKEELEKLFGYDKALELKTKIVLTETSIKQAEKEIEGLKEELELEAAIANTKELEEYLEDLDYLITLEPNTEEYNRVLNEILEADNSVLVEIKGELNDELKEAREELKNLKDVAATIGDDFLVSVEDLETLSATFPGILTNYTIMKDGMIKLNDEVVKNVLENAKDEIATNIEVQRQNLETQKILTQGKIDSLNKQIEKVKSTLSTESEIYGKTYTKILGENKFTEEEIRKHADETLLKTYENNQDTAESYEDTYQSALTNVKDFTETAIQYLDLLKKFSDPSTPIIEQDKIIGELRNIGTTISSTYGEDAELLNDIEAIRKGILENPNQDDKLLEVYSQKYWDEYFAKGIEQTKQELEGEILSLEEQKAEEEEQLASINSQLEALVVQEQQTNQHFDNIISGLGSDGKRDNKKEKELKTKDLMDEVDIYADIDDEIESINARLESQQEITSHLKEGTAEYLKSLDEEKKIIEELNKKYLEKKEMAKASLAGLQKEVIQLNGEITFSDDGRITNSAKVLSGLQNQINAVITEFNNSKDAAEQEILEAELEALEAHYESLEKAINQYRDTLDLIREIDQTLQENHYALQDIETNKVESVEKLKEEYEKKVKEWQEDNYDNLEKQLELSIRIDDNELKKLDYYVDKLSDDFYSMAEAAQYMVDKVPVISNSLGNYENFYNSISTAYANGEITQEDYLDGMQKSYDAILDNLSALNDLDKEMMHYYENTLAAAQEEINHYADSLEHLTSVLEHYKNIVELVDGEYNFDAIDTILRGQTQTIENEMEVAQATYEMMLREKQAIEASMASVETGSAAWELFNNELQAITEAVNEAEEKMLSKTEEWAEAMKAVMENTFNKAAYEMEMAMTSGMGFDALNNSLDRLNAYQDVYLTTTNEIYELSKLMRTAQQAADKTDSLSSKQKLKNYYKEIETLKNDGIPLSELELELAQARYDVLLAEIALEEAQNAKSTVRLQRDSEGNFGYVYTADSEAISQAEEDLMDAQNKLYNIGLEATNDYGQKILELQQKLSDDLLQLEQDRANGRFQTEADYEAAKALLIQEYNDLFLAYSDQYTTALGVDVAIQEEAWINAYDSMINQTQNWQEYTTEYTQRCEQAYDQWRTAVTEHNEIIQDILNNTKEKVNEVTKASDKLKEEVIREVIPAVEKELRQVRNITEAYAHQREAIQDLINYYEQLAAAIQEAIAAQAQMQMQQAAESYGEIEGIRDYSAAMSDYLEVEGHTMDDAYYKALKKAREEKMQQDEYSDEISTAELELLFAKYKKAKEKGVDNEMTQYVESISEGNGKYWDRDKVLEYVYGKSNISTYRSGGYTGEWGPSGRLAVLHEKELILNSDDTLNFLNAAEILRRVSDRIDLEAMTNSMSFAPFMGMLSSPIADNTLQQQVMIEANFPNVQNRNEIEEAISNLINTASQYANMK